MDAVLPGRYERTSSKENAMKNKAIDNIDYDKKIREDYPDLNILRKTNRPLKKDAYEKMKVLAENFMNEN